MADSRKIALGCAIGCGVLVVIMAVAASACGVWLWKQGQEIRADATDPERGAARALEILGVERLPDGYYVLTAFSVPFVMRTAVLTDRPPVAEVEGATSDRGFEERGFVYFEMVGFGQDEQELRDFFEGRTDDIGVLRDNGIQTDIEEVLGRGVLEIPGASVMYVLQRGDVRVQRHADRGLSALTLVDCPDDEKRRIGLWFGPDADDVAGTPADPEALRAFLAQFSFCG